jgi:hypothetical protein
MLELTASQKWDPRVPIGAHKWNMGPHYNKMDLCALWENNVAQQFGIKLIKK